MSNNQLTILQKIESIVKSITPANGYLSDLSNIEVIYWQDTDFEYNKKVIHVQDYPEEISKTNLSLENVLPVKISVIQPVDQINLRLISTQLATDFKQAFSLPSLGQELAGIHIRTQLERIEKKVETKGVKVLSVCTHLNIKYREEIKNG